MSKDDYHVIVYYLLSYLYYCIKRRIQPEDRYLNLEEYPVQINEAYLAFIYSVLMRKGFITGVGSAVTGLGKNTVQVVMSYQNAQITSDGIEYLQYNSTMSKIWDDIQEGGGLMLQLIPMFK